MIFEPFEIRAGVRCRQESFVRYIFTRLMHRPQSRDARTYVTGFHKRWHILSRATPATPWKRYVHAGVTIKLRETVSGGKKNICCVWRKVISISSRYRVEEASLMSHLISYLIARILWDMKNSFSKWSSANCIRRCLSTIFYRARYEALSTMWNLMRHAKHRWSQETR